MNKTELIGAVAEKAGLSKKDADKAVNAVLDAITDSLKAGDSVQLIGFGTFKVNERAERAGVNLRTKEAIIIPAAKVPSFKAGAALKAKIK